MTAFPEHVCGRDVSCHLLLLSSLCLYVYLTFTAQRAGQPLWVGASGWAFEPPHTKVVCGRWGDVPLPFMWPLARCMVGAPVRHQMGVGDWEAVSGGFTPAKPCHGSQPACVTMETETSWKKFLTVRAVQQWNQLLQE